MLNSRSGSYYATTGKLLNCLVGCLLMAIMAFAAIPYFLVSQSKATIAAHTNDIRPNWIQSTTAKSWVNTPMLYRNKTSFLTESKGKGKTVKADYGRDVRLQTMKAKFRAPSPAKFEIRKGTGKKGGNPDAM